MKKGVRQRRNPQINLGAKYKMDYHVGLWPSRNDRKREDGSRIKSGMTEKRGDEKETPQDAAWGRWKRREITAKQ